MVSCSIASRNFCLQTRCLSDFAPPPIVQRKLKLAYGSDSKFIAVRYARKIAKSCLLFASRNFCLQWVKDTI
jgi:hypothetical protein